MYYHQISDESTDETACRVGSKFLLILVLVLIYSDIIINVCLFFNIASFDTNF